MDLYQNIALHHVKGFVRNSLDKTECIVLFLKMNIKHFVVLPSIIHPNAITDVPAVSRPMERSSKTSLNIFNNLRKMAQKTKENVIEEAPELGKTQLEEKTQKAKTETEK